MANTGAQIAILQDGKVLLTKRADIPLWCLPGGAIEEGESPAQAAVREAKEETGLDVKVTDLVGIYTRTKAFNGSNHGIVFRGVAVGGHLVTATNETVDARYFGELPNDLLWWDRQRIQDALSGSCGNVWRQETTLAFGANTKEELLALYAAGAITAQQVMLAFTRPPVDSVNINELGSN